jgi:hypothetical protein
MSIHFPRALRLVVWVVFTSATLSCRGIPSKDITSSPPPDSATNVALRTMASQVHLLDLVQKLRGSPGAVESLGGLQIDVERRSLEVWWKGSLPEAQRSLITAAADRDKVATTVRAAQYSQTELLAAIQRYFDRDQPHPRELVYLAPSVDARGVAVGATENFDVSLLNLGVDAFILTTTPYQQLSRSADTPAWWGGAVIRAAVGMGGGVCTSGFSVNWGWSIDRAGGQGFLTADHCAPGGGVAVTTGAGVTNGTAFPKPRGQSLVLDAMLVDSSHPPPVPGPDPATGGVLYDGGVGTGEFGRSVTGISAPVPGMFVCHSGAVTGGFCNGLKVDMIKVSSLGGGFTSVQSQSLALTNFVPMTAARGGDSGGPVFALAPNGGALASGILVGVSSRCPATGPCPTPMTSLAFVDLQDVLTWFNVSLSTLTVPLPSPSP